MEVLQVRDAIEKRIDWMYGATGKPAEKGYMAALEDAVTSNEKSIISNLRIMEFRSVIRETGFEDMENFVDIIKVLYKDFSFGQAHKITGLNTKLPSHEDVERISKILGAAGARLDLPNIKALQAFLKPCKEMGKKAPGRYSVLHHLPSFMSTIILLLLLLLTNSLLGTYLCTKKSPIFLHYYYNANR